jgi:hypothetical protein
MREKSKPTWATAVGRTAEGEQVKCLTDPRDGPASDHREPLRHDRADRAAAENGTPMTKRAWTPNMEQRAGANLEARQVKCLIASEEHAWMNSHFDKLPKAVRRRLAESAFNICSACLYEETHKIVGRPTLANYFSMIERIERELRKTERL